MINTRPLSPILLTIIFSLALTACNNDTSNKQNISNQLLTQKYNKTTRLTGKVSNKKGNIRAGEVKATDGKNKFIASSQINKSSYYSISIPAGTELPVTLSYTPTSSDKDKLISVVIYPTFTKFDINDLTTLIAKKAKSLGGYSHSNMSIAADSTVGIPDANKTSTGFRGDPTTQYGGWH